MASRSLRERALTALRQRIRREPTEEDLNGLFVSVRRSGDRAGAILGATMVEDMLRRALLAKFRTLNAGETDRLFGPDQPLGSFSAKIKLAYALGMCDRRDAQNLDSLRAIRNTFAHDQKPLTFKTAEVHEICHHLHLPPRLRKSRNIARIRFFWVVSDLTARFGAIANPGAPSRFASENKRQSQ